MVVAKLEWKPPKLEILDKLTLTNDDKKQLLGRIGLEYSSFTKANYLSGNLVKVRSGRLRASFGDVVEGIFDLSSSRVEVGTYVSYSKILNDGGVISAQAGKALAIPLSPVLTPAGVPRFTWRQRGDLPKQFPDLFVMKTKNGKAFLAKKVGNRIIPYFKLQKSVTITGRHYIEKSATAFLPKIDTLIKEFLDEKANK